MKTSRLNKGKRLAAALPLMSIGVFGVMLLSVGAKPASAAGFPRPTCGPGFINAGPRLCIDQFVQSATDFDTAMVRCRNRFAYVASYGDLYYLYVNTGLDASYNPNGKWIGPDLSADDQALIGNRNITFSTDGDQENFEGTDTDIKDNIGVSRPYWCAHDDDG
jgi:hypothetical protein